MRVARKLYNFILVTLIALSLSFTTCSIVVEAGNTEEVTAVLTPNWSYGVQLVYTTGAEKSDGAYCSTNYITIIDGASYNVTIDATYSNHVAIFYYDSSNKFISYQNCWTGNTAQNSADLVLPDNAAYFRLMTGSGKSTQSINEAIVLAITLTETVIVTTGKSVEELLEISINGYESDVMEDATNTFSSEADILHNVESDLMDTSNQYVNDYTSEAFDTSFLDTLGDSLIFVVTWFTNFWNMGGAFTSCLNFLFALSIVFYIVRIR